MWWTVVSLGFGTYLGLASVGNAIFGFLGGAESALWLYLMAMGLLLGAEVNSIIATRRGVIFEAVRGTARSLAETGTAPIARRAR